MRYFTWKLEFFSNILSVLVDAVIKVTYLQTKHPQSIFPILLTLVLNSKTELLDLIWKQFLEVSGNEIIPAKSM